MGAGRRHVHRWCVLPGSRDPAEVPRFGLRCFGHRQHLPHHGGHPDRGLRHGRVCVEPAAPGLRRRHRPRGQGRHLHGRDSLPLHPGQAGYRLILGA